MSDENDFQKRVDAMKAEADAEVAADKRRRFTIFGHRRGGGFFHGLLGDMAVGAFVWLLVAASIVGAIAIGLGVSIKTALAIAAIAAIAALALGSMA